MSSDPVAQVPKYQYAQPFQRSVVQMMLREPTFVADLSDSLNAKYFEFDYLAIVAKLLLAHYRKYRELPSRATMHANVTHHVTRHGLDAGLRDEMIEFLKFAYTGDLPADRRYIRDKVGEFARMQAVKESIAESVRLLQDGAEDAYQKILPMMQKAVTVGSCTTGGIEIFSHAADPTRLRTEIADPVRRVPTMFTALDNALRGGLGGGQIGVVLGVTGRGKSMLLVNMATEAAKQGKRVIYISNELQPYEVGVRVLARLTNMPIADVEALTPDYQSAAKQLAQFSGGSVHLWYINPGSPVSMVRSIVSRMQAEVGGLPDVIFVDYADELVPTKVMYNMTDSTYMAYGDVYSELIALAADFRCPVWTASQVKRDAYADEVVTMASVSDSVKKIQKAHVVMSICQNQQEREQGRMRLWVEKVRNGPDQFAVPLTVDLSRCLMRQRGPMEDGPPVLSAPKQAG